MVDELVAGLKEPVGKNRVVVKQQHLGNGGA
jgi:hypothetical protein